MILPRVAVVVVHHGPEAPCHACLESLQDAVGVEVRGWVVDHNPAPSSGLAGQVSASGWGSYLHNPRNPGFAAGVNCGFRDARSAGDWAMYVALNSDVRLERNCLRELAEAFAANASLGVAGPGLIAAGEVGEPQRWWNLGSEIEWPSGRPRSLGHGEILAAEDPLPRDVGFVAGAVLAVSPAAVARLGLLDDSYFLYFEDADYCFRARASGFRTVVCPLARAWHTGGVATQALADRVGYFQVRNRLLFSKRWNPCPLRGAMHRLLFASRHICRGFVAAVMGWQTAAVWKGRGAWSYFRAGTGTYSGGAAAYDVPGAIRDE